MSKELAEAVKLFISQPLNNPLTSGQIMEVARIALPILEMQERACQKCGGTGDVDSGAHTAGGRKVMVKCDCKFEQQERGDGWIEWEGREIPGAVRGRAVQVRYATGEIETEYSGFLNWGNGSGKLVCAYRIIPEQPTNQNGEQ